MTIPGDEVVLTVTFDDSDFFLDEPQKELEVPQ